MNNVITKQIACQLFAWGYKLVDEHGVIHTITGINDSLIYVKDYLIPFGCIGKDFFILARSTDKLCEEIQGKIPLVECAKIEGLMNDEFEISVGISPSLKMPFAKQKNIRLCFYEENFGLFEGENPKSISNQQALFNHLYSLHFAINLPEGTCKEIEL